MKKFPNPLKLRYIKKGSTVQFSDGVTYHDNFFAEVAADRDCAKIHAVMKAFDGKIQRILPAGV